MELCIFQPNLEQKKNSLRENLSHFRKWKHQKKVLYITQREAVLMFHETETPKNFLHFRKLPIF